MTGHGPTAPRTGLFHGTRAPLRRGGLVLAPDDPLHVGPSDHHGISRSDRIYVTPDLALAEAYALAARGSGRPRVVEVLPWSPLEVDDSTIAGGAEQESYSCEGGQVIRVVVSHVVEEAPR